MLRLKAFKKYYHQRLILSIDELTILPGIYWIKGINGSGKSTLLKAIAGILHFEGSIILNDTLDIKKQVRAYRSLVNFAEAEPVFPPYLTGLDMISLFINAKNGTQAQADQYISDMQMQSFVAQPVNTYSSGMLKKLSLVLAFLGKPAIIVLDEPLITMDTAALGVLYGWIREKRAANVCFLLSSHQLMEEGELDITAILHVALQTIKLEQA